MGKTGAKKTATTAAGQLILRFAGPASGLTVDDDDEQKSDE